MVAENGIRLVVDAVDKNRIDKVHMYLPETDQDPNAPETELPPSEPEADQE